MKYMFGVGVEQVLTKYQVNKLQTWAAWPVFQIKEPKRLKLPRVSSHPELRYYLYLQRLDNLKINNTISIFAYAGRAYN